MTTQISTEIHEPGTEGTEPQQPETDEATTFDAEYVAKLRDESARHRVSAKDATERADAMTSRLRELAVRDAVREILQDPTDLPWSDDYADESGMPDAEKIANAARDLIKAKPHLARPQGDAGQGFRGEAPTMSLAEAMRLSV